MARNIVSSIEDTLIKDGTIEVHYFTTGETSRYIVGGVIKDYEIEADKILVDHTATLESYNIRRGEFNATINVYNPILGSAEYPMIYLKEISPDRQELRFSHVAVPAEEHSEHEGMLREFVNNILADQEPTLNFGQNRLFKIINQSVFEDHDLIIRLLDPLPNDIEEESTAWIVDQLSNSFNDNILLESTNNINSTAVDMRGPNFDIETTYGTITETDFESWNTLLDANTATSQNIVDSIFSGSLSGVKIGIDYSGFDNFVQFSSAKERVANFKYKLELIEYYSSRVTILNAASGSDTTALQNNVSINTTRKNDVIGSFDGFERWLYNENTSSLFTHHAIYETEDYEVEGGRIGSQIYRVSPWPKYLSASKYHLHETTSDLGTGWYNDVYATASLFDQENNSALLKTIPEHIRLDENNSQYELFVNMIGHHYDIVYSYINNLSNIYKPEEHPQLGQSKDTLYELAKSLGWSLTDGKQASALWQYKLGVSSGSGTYQSTGSLFSKSDESITTEIWRRIVNNLPYLLKTKGTARSVKALMNTYGIPQTLLSIREYGGPKVSGDVPTLIEDRFAYALHINSGSYIKIPNSVGVNGSETVQPITRQIRFKPSLKKSMALLTTFDATKNSASMHIAVSYTGSYSGSTNYGRITIADSGSMSGSTSYLPLYDGDIWNLQWNRTADLNTIHVQKASDYISGKVIHSASIGPLTSDGYGGSAGDVLYLGGLMTGSSISLNNNVNHFSDDNIGGFSGSVQEYREWSEAFTTNQFDLHTLNPTSYVSNQSPSSSYNTLQRHHPLGTDLDAIDLSTDGISIQSKHPQSGSIIISASTAHGFNTPINVERGNFVPIEETYYIQGVSLGGNVPRSQKIRLEDNELIRNLSTTNTAERSKFDRASLDTNRLGLFYSMADQINKEIFNQIGDVELDDYVGDPNDEFEISYNTLDHFSKEYWKKYTNRNDINAYIRIFSQFDFALFNQIKQLLPERVDEAMGLLVEPHALERVKVRVIKQPVITNPQYEVSIPDSLPSASGEYINYEGVIPFTENIITAESLYQTASNGYVDDNYLFNVQIISTGSYSGSVNEGFVLNSRTSTIYNTETFHFRSYASKSIGQYISRSRLVASYRDDEFIMIENQKFNGSKLTAPGINQASIYPQINYEPIIEVFAVNPNQLIFNETPEEGELGSLLVQ